MEDAEGAAEEEAECEVVREEVEMTWWREKYDKALAANTEEVGSIEYH